MRKKVIIIGSKGMAGHVVYSFLKDDPEFIVVDVARGREFHTPCYQLDVTAFSELKEMLEKEQPLVVVNCIGVLNKDAEDNPDKAVLLNSYFPHFLAHCGNDFGFKLIHISTDCVFSGKDGSYIETSPKDGIGFYAQSKALGEVTYDSHLTLRTSIIGPELKDGIGLFNWFMNQSGAIKGYTQAYWTGVTTIELAKAVKEAIAQDISGLYHLVNGEKISKFSLTGLFKEVFEKDNMWIEPFADYRVDKSLINTRSDFKYEVPSYKVMVEEMKHWIERSPGLYKY